MSAKGPKVDVPADGDPREFLVDVTASANPDPIKLTVRYYACDDAETFCISVKQHYTIRLEPDRDAGRVRQAGRGSRDPAGNLAQRILSRDKDGDGKVSRSEASGRLLRGFDRFDANADGFVDQAEIDGFIERRGRTRRGR